MRNAVTYLWSGLFYIVWIFFFFHRYIDKTLLPEVSYRNKHYINFTKGYCDYYLTCPKNVLWPIVSRSSGKVVMRWWSGATFCTLQACVWSCAWGGVVVRCQNSYMLLIFLILLWRGIRCIRNKKHKGSHVCIKGRLKNVEMICVSAWEACWHMTPCDKFKLSLRKADCKNPSPVHCLAAKKTPSWILSVTSS